MIDKNHLQDKKVAFRFNDGGGVYVGIVKYVEKDASGFWIESNLLIQQLLADQSWKGAAQQIATPVFFVPASSLMYLIATNQ